VLWGWGWARVSCGCLLPGPSILLLPQPINQSTAPDVPYHSTDQTKSYPQALIVKLRKGIVQARKEPCVTMSGALYAFVCMHMYHICDYCICLDVDACVDNACQHPNTTHTTPLSLPPTPPPPPPTPPHNPKHTAEFHDNPLKTGVLRAFSLYRDPVAADAIREGGSARFNLPLLGAFLFGISSSCVCGCGCGWEADAIRQGGARRGLTCCC
jgi:hypothetical protein